MSRFANVYAEQFAAKKNREKREAWSYFSNIWKEVAQAHQLFIEHGLVPSEFLFDAKEAGRTALEHLIVFKQEMAQRALDQLKASGVLL